MGINRRKKWPAVCTLDITSTHTHTDILTYSFKLYSLKPLNMLHLHCGNQQERVTTCRIITEPHNLLLGSLNLTCCIKVKSEVYGFNSSINFMKKTREKVWFICFGEQQVKDMSGAGRVREDFPKMKGVGNKAHTLSCFEEILVLTWNKMSFRSTKSVSNMQFYMNMKGQFSVPLAFYPVH